MMAAFDAEYAGIGGAGTIPATEATLMTKPPLERRSTASFVPCITLNKLTWTTSVENKTFLGQLS
jgi:hypothetical protein